MIEQRRRFMMGLTACVVSLPFAGMANAKGLGLGSILCRATDSALDQLAQPGAFYGDEAIRIGLPLIGGAGAGGALSSIVGGLGKTGLLDGLVRTINDAAGVAAGEAKPIFRGAIDDLSFSDVPGIVSQNDGATQYLRTSAGDELQGKLRPLVDTALGDLGAYDQMEKLGSKHSFLGLAGIGRDGLGGSVTKQGLNGIFSYIGNEEGKLRANPIGKAGGLLKGVLGN